MVQDLALFPHMTVAENIGFAIAGWKRDEREARLAELIELLGLEGLEQRLPRQISGGQQQRVAIGRALAARPRVLLLDEPFTALDTPTRAALRREVARLRRQLGLLTVFVTHDLQEAFALADRIIVYDQGAVLQSGARDEVFRHRPASGSPTCWTRATSSRAASLPSTRSLRRLRRHGSALAPAPRVSWRPTRRRRSRSGQSTSS